MRKIYGLIRAFEQARCESDWRMPKGQNAKNWKSKVRWTLLEEYDVESLDREDWEIEEADLEVTERLKQRALFNKHLAGVEESEAARGSTQRESA